MQQFPFPSLKHNRAYNWLGFSFLPHLSKVDLNPLHEDHIAVSAICFTHKHDHFWISICICLIQDHIFLIIYLIFFLTTVLFKGLYQSTIVTLWVCFPFLHNAQFSQVQIFCKYNSLAVSRRYSLQYLLKPDLFY